MGVESSDKARKSYSTGTQVVSSTLQKVGSDVLRSILPLKIYFKERVHGILIYQLKISVEFYQMTFSTC